MDIHKSLTLNKPEELHHWLQENHQTKIEVWSIFYKIFGQTNPEIAQAVNEFLYFRWIQSRLKPIDPERFAVRSSPRRRGSIWSLPNLKRIRKLITQGKMTEARVWLFYRQILLDNFFYLVNEDPAERQEKMTDSQKQKVYLDTILATCPGIQLRSAPRLQSHDGEYNDILIVNDELIFRFPRHAGKIPDFFREIQLLRKIRKVLPLPIPDPIYDSGHMTEPGKVFMGYPLIPGEPLYPQTITCITEEADLQGIAKQLADFLSALHHLTPSMLGLDLPLEEMPAWLRAFFMEVSEHLFPYMRPDACQTLSGNFDHYFNAPELHDYQPTIIHGDFGGSNILLDKNKISGILDFSSTCYSDAALDIAAVSTYGEPFFTRICQFYPVSKSMLRRAKFYRSIFALEEALYGWKNGDKGAFDRGMEQFV